MKHGSTSVLNEASHKSLSSIQLPAEGMERKHADVIKEADDDMNITLDFDNKSTHRKSTEVDGKQFRDYVEKEEDGIYL